MSNLSRSDLWSLEEYAEHRPTFAPRLWRTRRTARCRWATTPACISRTS